MLDHFFREPAIQEIFSARGDIQSMLDVEAALARAEACCGIIPAAAADRIVAACRAADYDLDALAAAARDAGNLAIPLIKALTARVAQTDREAARWVHWGATSQDILDTARVLQVKASCEWTEQALGTLIARLAEIVRAERATVMPGRTWLQQAVPVTFGLKAAGWLDGLLRDRMRLQDARSRLFAVQFGGAAGTLASLDEKGLEVAAELGRELHLGVPALPWHAQRDRIVEAGSLFGLLTGTLGKIARDLSLLGQTEVGEAFEPAGPERGGSSTMPHKRNPVGCAVALAAAVRVPGLVATLYAAMPQEHERSLGLWPAEWETLPEIIGLTAGSLATLTRVLMGLHIDAARMRANLDGTHGLLYAERLSFRLAGSLGKQAAHELVARACERARSTQQHLRITLAQEAAVTAVLSAGEIDALFDPASALGVTQQFIDRVLAQLDR